MKRFAAGVGLVLCVAMASPGLAGDNVRFEKVPDWVRQQPFAEVVDPADKTALLPRFDEQIQIDGDNVTVFIDASTFVASPEMLNQKGTLSLPWQPAHGDLTIYRIDILRGGKTIDALKGGAGVTVIRRESGLEKLSVDGVLTAVKHIDDLQVGDRLRISFSISSRDKVLGGNVADSLFVIPQPARFEFGRARLVWRDSQAIKYKVQVPGLLAEPKPAAAGWSEISVPLPIAKLPEMPKNAPARFTPNPVVQFSSFADWDAVAKVMAPLYRPKGMIADGSDLASRIDRIASQSADPLVRTAEALRFVQDEVRYQLIAIGTGNYVPQKPEDTWEKRFGDCKAKTLLLLAILDRLGIEAEPVLANIKQGDSLTNLIASTAVFDHVFVRARIKGEDFWLDGTGLGSRLEDIRDVPRFGYVLPVFTGGELLALPRRANARPEVEVRARYDLTGGPHMNAPVTLTARYYGPGSVKSRVQSETNYDEELVKFSEKLAKTWIGSDIIGKPSANYDANSASWTLTFDAVATPGWQYVEGRYQLSLSPPLRVVLDAPRDRASWRAIPALIDQPWTAHAAYSYVLPDLGKTSTVSGTTGRHLEFPAVDWHRTVANVGGILSDEIMSRETSEEIAAKDISVQAKAIETTMDEKVHITLAPSYPQKWLDLQARSALPAAKRVAAIYDQRVATNPDDGERVAQRATYRESILDWAGAEADLTKAIAIDPVASRYLARSTLRTRRGDHAGALADARKAYELEEGNASVRNQLASELALSGKVDDALALLPDNSDPSTDGGLSDLMFRSEILNDGGRYPQAVELLDGLIEKRKKSAALFNTRCWIRGLHNDALEDALKDCNEAVELSPGPGYYDSRALVHFRSGRLAEAAADYAKVLANYPDIPSSLFMAGIVAQKMGHKEEGAASIAAARKLHPNIDTFYSRYGIKP
ncbi:hypothetical protein OKA06_16140 [Novosphingobium sp. MW5]|nr:hypothetical protein [Novosphingobium sp. MW5]